jgi:hypothetical protein
MAIDFPANPTNGQQYQNFYYDSSITAWRNLGSKNALSSAVTGLQTANATTNQAGLVPVVPTSVNAITGGTASYSTTTGLTTFSGVSGIRLNGVFSATYSEYVIKFYGTAVVSNYGYFQFCSGGTTYSSLNYDYLLWAVGSTETSITRQGGNTAQDASRFCYVANNGCASTIQVHRPYQTSSIKTFEFSGTYGNGTYQFGSGALEVSGTAFDGFQITPIGTTFTGTVQVFGVKS